MNELSENGSRGRGQPVELSENIGHGERTEIIEYDKSGNFVRSWTHGPDNIVRSFKYLLSRMPLTFARRWS